MHLSSFPLAFAAPTFLFFPFFLNGADHFRLWMRMVVGNKLMMIMSHSSTLFLFFPFFLRLWISLTHQIDVGMSPLGMSCQVEWRTLHMHAQVRRRSDVMRSLHIPAHGERPNIQPLAERRCERGVLYVLFFFYHTKEPKQAYCIIAENCLACAISTFTAACVALLLMFHCHFCWLRTTWPTFLFATHPSVMYTTTSPEAASPSIPARTLDLFIQIQLSKADSPRPYLASPCLALPRLASPCLALAPKHQDSKYTSPGTRSPSSPVCQLHTPSVSATPSAPRPRFVLFALRKPNPATAAAPPVRVGETERTHVELQTRRHQRKRLPRA
jgi:hypothetical protein